MAENAKRDITYLWVHVSKEGIAQPKRGAAAPKHPPTVQDWLNVVDEAASIGVNWLMVTLDTRINAFPELIEICQWAQDTYQMRVGLHVSVNTLTEEEVASVRQLNLDLTRLFVKRSAMPNMQSLEAQGIKIRAADPQDYGEKPDCQGAGKLVFVDAHGVLYTCGLVEGNHEYRLGNIHERAFESLLHDPALPHAIHDNLHKVSEGCDGCPSLIANFLRED